MNASAVHFFGREGRRIIEEARQAVAALVGAPPAQVIFNSGATEGNNTVIQHFSRAYPQQRILVSAIEHPSVLQAAPNLERIPVRSDGTIDPQALERMMTSGGEVALVSVMAVNNETGAIQDVSQLSAIARKHGAFVHSDAVQAAGRIPST